MASATATARRPASSASASRLAAADGGPASGISQPYGCPTAPLRVNWSAVTNLGGVCRLDLGRTRYEHAIKRAQEAGLARSGASWVELRATLDPGYEVRSDVEPDYAINGYLTRYARARSVDWSALQSNLEIDAEFRHTGLYWNDGWGMVHRGLLHALNLLFTYADAAVDNAAGANLCGIGSGAQLRAALKSGALPVAFVRGAVACDDDDTSGIIVDAGGRVNAYIDSNSALGFWTALSPIFLCLKMGVHAALADYYFWWARRLRSFRLDTGHEWYGFLGMCAARAGMTQIVELAGSILHEYGHMLGRWTHCGGADMRYRCCHYTMELAFRERVRADLALPQTQVFGNTALSPYRAFNDRWGVGRFSRFDYTANDRLSSDVTLGTSEPNCSPITVRCIHCGFWLEGRRVEWTTILPSDACAEAGQTRTRHREVWGPCPDDATSSGNHAPSHFYGDDGPAGDPPPWGWPVPELDGVTKPSVSP